MRTTRLGRGRIASERPLPHICRLTICFLAVLVLSGPALLAGDLQTWNQTSYTVLRTPKLRWSAGGTFRFAETIGDLYDRRAATKVDYEIGKGVTASAAYLFRNSRESELAANENRIVLGVSYPLLRTALDVEGSTFFERHFVPSEDFNRYRQQFDVLQHGKKLSPWLQQQFNFQRGEGFIRYRVRLGFRWRRSVYSLKAAYQFESRLTGTAWLPRHAIYTEVSIDHPFWVRERQAPATP